MPIILLLKIFSFLFIENNNESQNDIIIKEKNKIKKRKIINELNNEEKTNNVQIYKKILRYNSPKTKNDSIEDNKTNKKSDKSFNPQKKFKTQYIHINKESDLDSEINLKKEKNSFIKKTSNNNISIIKNSEKNILHNNNSLNIKRIKNSFNIIEIIITQLFKCCICNNMKIKNDINENANKIIYKKLDIITYIRNMILFDIINKTILDNNKKDIINFLCRPIISINKNKKNEFDDFYKIYEDNDFNKFSNNIKELLRKDYKKNKENRLINISKEYLEEFL